MTETRRVRMTKKMIKEALLELLENNVPGKITVTEICAAADVNRSTFYAYYEDVPKLLQEIENDILEQIPVSPNLPTSASNDVFLNMLTEFFEYVRQNERLFRLLMIQADSRDFNERLIQSVLEKYQNFLLKDTLLARYGYVYCINGVIGLLKEWIEGGFPIDSRKFSTIVLRMSIQANEIAYEPR